MRPKLVNNIGSFAKKKSFFSRIDTPIFLSVGGPSVGPSYGEYDLVLIVEEKRPLVFLLQLTP